MAPSANADDGPLGATPDVAQVTKRFVRAGRRVSSRYLDNYQRLVGHVIDAQQKLAERSRNEAIRSIVRRTPR
jgi:hypothetical protein